MRRTRFLGAAAAGSMIVAGCASMAQQANVPVSCDTDCTIHVTITDPAGACKVDDPADGHVGRNKVPVITWDLPAGFEFPKKGIDFGGTGSAMFIPAGHSGNKMRMLDRNNNSTQQSYKYTINVTRSSDKTACTQRDPTILNDGCDPAAPSCP